MTWTDIKQLEKSLTDDTLSDNDVFYYLVTSSLITAIIPYVSDNRSDNKILLFIELLFAIIFTLVLLKATFNINNNGDKRDYLKRFISLSLVSFIRLFLFSLAPIILLTVTLKIIESMGILEYVDVRQAFLFSLTILMSIAYYVMLTNSFKRVSQVN